MALGINTVLHWLRCPQHEDFSLDGVDNWDQVDAKSRTHSAFNPGYSYEFCWHCQCA